MGKKKAWSILDMRMVGEAFIGMAGMEAFYDTEGTACSGVDVTTNGGYCN